jgi:hypothetical protein
MWLVVKTEEGPFEQARYSHEDLETNARKNNLHNVTQKSEFSQTRTVSFRTTEVGNIANEVSSKNG